MFLRRPFWCVNYSHYAIKPVMRHIVPLGSMSLFGKEYRQGETMVSSYRYRCLQMPVQPFDHELEDIFLHRFIMQFVIHAIP